MLREATLFGTVDLVQRAIERLRYFEPSEGYYLAFSGGKDSVVIKHLAEQAGVKFETVHNLTTIDPPELMYFMREHHPDVVIDHPEKPFLVRLTERGFPQRHRRWCCEEYKERGGSGRFVVTGIRAAESNQRRNRKMVEHCYKDITKYYVNPIIDWTDEQVWQYIRENKLPYCSLYDEGWKRIGCLFCPMAGKMRSVQAERYPRYVKAFIKAFQKLYTFRMSKRKKYQRIKSISVSRWKDGEEMFWWWLKEDRKRAEPDQLMIFE